jgi:hypothetical protein
MDSEINNKIKTCNLVSLEQILLNNPLKLFNYIKELIEIHPVVLNKTTQYNNLITNVLDNKHQQYNLITNIKKMKIFEYGCMNSNTPVIKWFLSHGYVPDSEDFKLLFGSGQTTLISGAINQFITHGYIITLEDFLLGTKHKIIFETNINPLFITAEFND